MLLRAVAVVLAAAAAAAGEGGACGAAGGDGAEFRGRVALVTGSTSGIGRATALLLAARGASVVVTGRSDDRGRAVVARIEAAGGEAAWIRADMAIAAERVALFAAARERFGAVDLLVNNHAAVEDHAAHVKRTHELDLAVVERMFQVGGVATWHVLQLGVAQMLDSGRGGAVVNMGSLLGLKSSGLGVGPYSMLKAGVHQLTRAAALEYATDRIRINAIAPGYIRTELTDSLHPSVLEHINSKVPIGRMGTVNETAEGIAFLLPDRAGYMTGEVLPMTGGSSAN